MKLLALDLDHVGVAAYNLDEAERTFRRLGFTLTKRSHHRGSRAPGLALEDWGSANHCAMLERGYIEIIGLTDSNKFSSVKPMLELYQGTHIVAFRPDEVQLVHDSLAARGLPVDAIRDLERMTEFGVNGSEQKRVAFRNMYLERSFITEARMQYTQHLTPDVMWQPQLLSHSNGAIALSHLFLCSSQAGETAAKLSPFVGVAPQHVGKEDYALRFLQSEIRVVSPHAWKDWAPGAGIPPVPAAPAGFGIKVRSLAGTREYLAGHGIEMRHGRGGGLWVDPEYAGNTVLYFFE